MASGWFGGRAIELVKARSLFVKVTPTPASLSERRAVMHALRRYGQIDIFKRLPNPETFVCAPAKSEIASQLVSRSPVTFKFVSETLDRVEAKSLPGISPIGAASPIHIHEDYKAKHLGPDSDTDASTAGPGAEAQSQSDLIKTFTLHINPSQSYYEHKTNIRLSPIHGPWPRTPKEDQDHVYFALRRVLPSNAARQGLCDWHTGGQLSDEPAAIRAQHANSRLWHIRERQMRKRTSREMEGDGRSGLVALGGLAGVTFSPALQKLQQQQQQQPQPQPQQQVVSDHFMEMERLAHREGRQQQQPQQEVKLDPVMVGRLAHRERRLQQQQQQQQQQMMSDPFTKMERSTHREEGRTPAWVRRKMFQLNPLANGKHYKIAKKMPIDNLKSAWKWYDFKPVYNSQMDNVKLPRMERLEGKS